MSKMLRNCLDSITFTFTPPHHLPTTRKKRIQENLNMSSLKAYPRHPLSPPHESRRLGFKWIPEIWTLRGKRVFPFASLNTWTTSLKCTLVSNNLFGTQSDGEILKYLGGRWENQTSSIVHQPNGNILEIAKVNHFSNDLVEQKKWLSHNHHS